MCYFLVSMLRQPELYHNYSKKYWQLYSKLSQFINFFWVLQLFLTYTFKLCSGYNANTYIPECYITWSTCSCHLPCCGRGSGAAARDEAFNPLPRTCRPGREIARYKLATATREQNIFSSLFPLLDRDRVINTWLTGSAPLSFILILAPVWCGSKTGYNKETSHKPETFIPAPGDLGTD